MSGSALLLAIIIPVLAVAGLGVWIGGVMHADHRSRRDQAADPGPLSHRVKGGAFRGGGRQVMPRRDAVPPEARDYQAGRRG